jgi:haloacetate dehalogenase
VLWGERGVVHRLFSPLDDWRDVATDVRGCSLPCGHYIAEELPDETVREFRTFFAP